MPATNTSSRSRHAGVPRARDASTKDLKAANRASARVKTPTRPVPVCHCEMPLGVCLAIAIGIAARHNMARPGICLARAVGPDARHLCGLRIGVPFTFAILRPWREARVEHSPGYPGCRHQFQYCDHICFPHATECRLARLGRSSETTRLPADRSYPRRLVLGNRGKYLLGHWRGAEGANIT